MSKTRTSNSPAPDAASDTADRFDVLHRLLKLENRLNAPFSEHLEKRYQVTMNEFRVVMLIGRFGAAASHELAELSGVTTMSISRAVTSLERKGWITSSIDHNNRRRKIIRLTKAGQNRFRQMLPTAEKVANHLFEALRPDEILAFDRYVTTLIESLEARDDQGRSIFIENTRPDS